MKQFLVLCAVLPLMLVLMLQFTLDQVNSNKINAVNQCVYAAKERAQQEGFFSAEIISDLSDGLDKVGFTDSQREMSFDDFNEPQSIGTLLNYSVSVRIRNAMVGFLSSETAYNYIIDSCTVSQYVEIP